MKNRKRISPNILLLGIVRFFTLYMAVCGAVEAGPKEASFYQRLDDGKVWCQLCFNPTSALRQFSSGSPTEELEKVSVTHFDLEKCLSVGSECL